VRPLAQDELAGVAAGAGDHVAADRLVSVVYEKLRAIAGSYLKHERPDVSLEPGMLVHEAYLRLVESPDEKWVDEAQFLRVAAVAMRRVLVDHARKRCALKRGFGHARISMDNVAPEEGASEAGIEEIDAALRKLEAAQPRLARVVELRFFAGLSHQAIANVLGVSRKTVIADWSRAREALARELTARNGPPHDEPERRTNPHGHNGQK